MYLSLAVALVWSLAIVVLYLGVTRRRGLLVLISWVTVPPLVGVGGLWGTFAVMDIVGTGHCGHEDYLCDDWAPMAAAHTALLVFALAGPAVVTALWIRERRKPRPPG